MSLYPLTHPTKSLNRFCFPLNALVCSLSYRIHTSVSVSRPDIMAAPAAEGSTLPASLLATDTHNALKRHVFPPFYPSPSQFEQARDPSSTDMSMNDSGAPSPTTHALFELYGAFK